MSDQEKELRRKIAKEVGKQCGSLGPYKFAQEVILKGVNK